MAGTQSCGIPNVNYDKKFLQTLDQNSKRLAGALGFSFTTELWSLCFRDADSKPLLDQWVSLRSSKFNDPRLTDQQMVIKPTIVHYADTKYHKILTFSRPPRIGRGDTTRETLPSLTLMWLLVRLIEKKGTLFPRSEVRLTGEKIIQLDNMDIVNGWKVFSWVYRCHKANKISAHPTKQPSEPPIFHNDNIPQQEAEAAPQEEHRALDTSNIFDDEGQDDESESESAQKETEEFSQQSALQISIALGNREAMQSTRPFMTSKERKSLVQALLRKNQFQSRCITNPDTFDDHNRKQKVINRDLSILTASGEGYVMQYQEEFQKKIKDESMMSDELDVFAEYEDRNIEQQLTKVTAEAPDYHKACEKLGISPGSRELCFTDCDASELKPWQITGVAWMIEQEDGPIHGGILADGCGTGKTFTALLLVYYAAVQRSHIPQSPRLLFRPTLILCLRTCVDQWLEEIHNRFGNNLRVILSYGTKKPLILSTYGTWAMRSTEFVRTDHQDAEGLHSAEDFEDELDDELTEEENTSRKVNKGRVPMQDRYNPVITRAIDELGELQDTQEKEPLSDHGRKTKTRKLRRFATNFENLFDRVICDEGHKVKSISTRTHQSVAQLNARYNWFLSATPMGNRVVDICGYLAILYQPSFDKSGQTSKENDPLKEYKKYGNKALQSPLPLHLLSPLRFVQLANKGHLTARDGYYALPVILKLICLQRTMEDKIDRPDGGLIGDTIPICRVVTPEFIYPKEMQDRHNLRYFSLISALNPRSGSKDHALKTVQGIDDPNGRPSVNWRVLRRLCHLGFSLKLDEFLSNVSQKDTLYQNVAKMIDREDRGFNWFFHKSNRDHSNLPPSTRFGQAYYLAYESAKLRYLLYIMDKEGAFEVDTEKGQTRFIIICHWPLNMWQIEMLLDALSVDFVSIRSNMKSDERQQALEHFTRKENKCSALITTYSCGSTGLNLHAACSRVICMEPALNTNTLFQTFGRVHRLGQEEEQKVWVLFQDHTISRYLECNNARKILPQLAAQLRSSLLGQLKEQNIVSEGADDQMDVDEMDVDERYDTAKDEEERAITDETDKYLQNMLGQSRSRLSFDDPEDLGFKSKEK